MIWDHGFISQTGHCIVILSKALPFPLLCNQFDVWRVTAVAPAQVMSICWREWTYMNTNIWSLETNKLCGYLVRNCWSEGGCCTLLRCMSSLLLTPFIAPSFLFCCHALSVILYSSPLLAPITHLFLLTICLKVPLTYLITTYSTLLNLLLPTLPFRQRWGCHVTTVLTPSHLSPNIGFF